MMIEVAREIKNLNEKKKYLEQAIENLKSTYINFIYTKEFYEMPEQMQKDYEKNKKIAQYELPELENELKKVVEAIEANVFFKLRNIFDIPFEFVKVGNKKGIKFHIYTKEDGHNISHCHAIYGDKSISISLIDFKILAGNLDSRHQNMAIEWAKDNIEYLKSNWEKYHGQEVI